MKHLLLLLAVLSATLALYIEVDDETHGCIIEEGEDTCCWLNNNGCCRPPRPGMACTMAITECCKTRVYDEETKTYKYTYSHNLGHGKKIKEKDRRKWFERERKRLMERMRRKRKEREEKEKEKLNEK